MFYLHREKESYITDLMNENSELRNQVEKLKSLLEEQQKESILGFHEMDVTRDEYL